jgi:hypothetical protein
MQRLRTLRKAKNSYLGNLADSGIHHILPAALLAAIHCIHWSTSLQEARLADEQLQLHCKPKVQFQGTMALLLGRVIVQNTSHGKYDQHVRIITASPQNDMKEMKLP